MGITILFSMKQSRLSWATVYRQFGLDCYSGQKQFNQKLERAELNYISECSAGRERKFCLRGQNEPVTPLGVCLKCMCALIRHFLSPRAFSLTTAVH